MVQLQASGLPTWAQVSERRLAHIQRVTSLLRAWGAIEARYPGWRGRRPRKAAAAGKRMGYFNASDAGSRSIGFRLVTEIEGRFVYHLAVQAVAHFLDTDPVLQWPPDEPPRIVIDDVLVPTEVYGRFYPNYYGPRNTFKQFSVADIVDGRVPHALLGELFTDAGVGTLITRDATA